MPKASGKRAKKPKKQSDKNKSSDIPSSDEEKLMEQPKEDLSKAMDQLSVTTGNRRKNSPSLSDMPIDVVCSIIEKLDYRQHLKLRKVSKSLRELVDEQKPACTRLEVEALGYFHCIICNYNDHCVAYVSPDWNRAGFSSQYKNYRLDTIITDAQFAQIAFDDLAFTLENPKLQLEIFSFCSDGSYGVSEVFEMSEYEDFCNTRFSYKFEDMQKLLKSMYHQISVKSCGIDITNTSHAMSVLPYLKPGVLEKIKILPMQSGIGWNPEFNALPQIARLEQWKQAKELELQDCFYEFPLEYAADFKHFKRFQFSEEPLEPRRLIKIRNYILEHKNVEFCSIEVDHVDAKDFESVVGTPVSPNLSHYSIPDSDHYLEFKFLETSIEIRKIKKS